MSKLFIIFFLILFSLIGTTYSGDQYLREGLSRKETKLIKIKREIREKKQAVKTFGSKERSALTGLNRIEDILSKRREELKLLNSEIDKLKKKTEITSNRISGIEEDIRTINLKLKTCLKTTYKMGGPRYLKAVFSSSSYADISRCYKYISIVINYNSKLIKEYEYNILALREKKKELVEDQSRLFALKVEKEKKESDIKARIQKKSNALRSIKKKKNFYTAKVKKLEKDSKSLHSMIEKLRRTMNNKTERESLGRAARGFAALRGKLDMPVSGKIVSLFGRQEDPALNTFTFYKGIDILAPMGSKIRAVYNGRVLFSEWFKGYGKIIIVDHGNSYYTLFAHTSQLLKQVGDKVKKGEVIALVGNTDSTKGPCLYFEIRYHGKPQNPMDWLASASP